MTKIVRTEKRKRGFLGHLFKWLFILFNVVMLIALIAGLRNVGTYAEGLHTEAQRAGAAAGATIGIGLVLAFWAAGDIILGMLVFFTRGKVSIIEERVE